MALILVYTGTWLNCMNKLRASFLDHHFKKDIKHCTLLLPCTFLGPERVYRPFNKLGDRGAVNSITSKEGKDRFLLATCKNTGSRTQYLAASELERFLCVGSSPRDS